MHTHFRAANCVGQPSFINDVLFWLPQVDLGPEDEFIVLACDGIWYRLEFFFLPLFTRMISLTSGCSFCKVDRRVPLWMNSTSSDVVDWTL